jgi:hypothetical protein
MRRTASALAALTLTAVLLVAPPRGPSDALASGMDAKETGRPALHGPLVVEALEDAHWAVLEDERGNAIELPRTWLPARAREGDVLAVELTPAAAGAAQRIVLTLDAAATEERRRALAERHRRIPRAPSGDLDL